MSGRGKRVSTGGGGTAGRASPAPRKTTGSKVKVVSSKGTSLKAVFLSLLVAFIGVVYALDQIRVSVRGQIYRKEISSKSCSPSTFFRPDYVFSQDFTSLTLLICTRLPSQL